MRTVDSMIKGSSKGLETAKRMKERASGEISGYKEYINNSNLGRRDCFSTPFDGKVDNATAEYKAAVGSMLTQFRKFLQAVRLATPFLTVMLQLLKRILVILMMHF